MKKRGFTLVELCITISLIGILFATSSLLLSSGLDSYEHIHARGDSSQRARYALERMVREIRSTTMTLQSISASSVGFLDSQNQNATFSYNSGTQTLSRGTDTLLENVTALTFIGYDQNNSSTTTSADVWRLHIALTTLPEGETASFALNTDVYLRNLMYENFR